MLPDAAYPGESASRGTRSIVLIRASMPKLPSDRRPMPSDITRAARHALLIAAVVEIPLALAYYVVGMPLETQPGLPRLLLWLCQFPGILLLDPIGTTWPAATGTILRPSGTQVAVLAVVNGAVIALLTYAALRSRDTMRRSGRTVSHA